MPGKAAVRQQSGSLPSGRYQARYRGPDGIDRPARRPSERKTDAERMAQHQGGGDPAGDWIAPERGQGPFADYAESWIAISVLKPRTGSCTGACWRITCSLPSANGLGDIREADVRRWRKERLDGGTSAEAAVRTGDGGQGVPAAARHLEHGGRRTASSARNPCRIKGAGQEDSHERAVVPVGGPDQSCSTRSRRGTGRWCCWPRSRTCAGVSWPGSGAITSTLTLAWSACPYRLGRDGRRAADR